MTHYDQSFTNDLKSKLTDMELMDKYGVSQGELRKMLFTLIQKGAVSSKDVYWRPIIYDYDAERETRRSTPRTR